MSIGELKTTFNAAATGTQYMGEGGSAGVSVKNHDTISWTISHPNTTTTDYTVQVSNMTDAEVLAGSDDWADYSGITVTQQTTAAKVAVGYTKPVFGRVRLKAVTGSGTGTIVVRQCIRRTE